VTPCEFEDCSNSGATLGVVETTIYQAAELEVTSGGDYRRIPFFVAADDLPGLVAALYESAGLPAPLTIDRVTPPLGGPWRPRQGAALLANRIDNHVAVGFDSPAGSSAMATITPSQAREMAAVLVAYADEADAEPDPAEVEELAGEMSADVRRIGGSPPEEWRIAARAALRWMRDREAGQ
jgi:hypothetical protein